MPISSSFTYLRTLHSLYAKSTTSTTTSSSINNARKCSDDAKILTTTSALSKMEEITHTVSTDPLVLAVIASGGAAGSGDVVSEGQAYGLLAAALALAEVEPNEANYGDIIDKFWGYFNGWKRMCMNSSAPCQSSKYCK